MCVHSPVLIKKILKKTYFGGKKRTAVFSFKKHTKYGKNVLVGISVTMTRVHMASDNKCSKHTVVLTSVHCPGSLNGIEKSPLTTSDLNFEVIYSFEACVNK